MYCKELYIHIEIVFEAMSSAVSEFIDNAQPTATYRYASETKI
jgi:hypothetical protein